MIYPMNPGAFSVHAIQPYFVLSTGKKYYQQSLVDSPIAHFYSFVADKSDGFTFAVPDASIDILFLCDKDNPKVRVCGSTTTAKLVEIQAGKRYFGARFRPGFVPSFIDAECKTLIDAEFSLQEMDAEADSLLECIVNTEDFSAQMDYFLKHYQSRLSRGQSVLSQQISQLVLVNNGDIRIRDLENYTGYSSRYINKNFTDHFGISPKMYALICRFQYILQRLTSQQDISLTHLALSNGYADQSHFLREFKRFAVHAPSKFLQMIEHSAYQERIDFNQ